MRYVPRYRVGKERVRYCSTVPSGKGRKEWVRNSNSTQSTVLVNVTSAVPLPLLLTINQHAPGSPRAFRKSPSTGRGRETWGRLAMGETKWLTSCLSRCMDKQSPALKVKRGGWIREAQRAPSNITVVALANSGPYTMYECPVIHPISAVHQKTSPGL